MNKAVLLAVVASCFWGIGTAMQKHGVEASFPKISLKNFVRQVGPVLKALVLHPTWSIGTISMLGGMICYAYALAHGDISLVQPLVNLTMVIAALIGVIFLHEKVSAVEWAGIAVMLIGVVFITQQRGGATSVEPSTGRLALVAGVFTILIVAGLFAGKAFPRLRMEFTLSVAAGFCFGLANTMGKVLTQRVIAEVGEFSLSNPACLTSLFFDFPLWFVIGANVFGFLFSQTAFANGRVSLISPIMTILSNTAPVLAALYAFSEQVGWFRGVGIVLAVAGTAMLAMRKEDESGS